MSNGTLELLRVSRRAMATNFEIALPVGTPDGLAAAESSLDLIDAIEDELTVYRTWSPVSELNRVMHLEPVRVSERLMDLLVQSQRLAQVSGGAFDPASGALIALWNRAKAESRIPTPAELAVARQISGLRHLMIDPYALTVKSRREGVTLNFGAVGKGFALDCVAEHLKSAWGIHSAILQAGGSSVRTLGTPPNEPRGWPVAIRHPSDREHNLGTIHLVGESLGTSAATYQYFDHAGKRYGHLIDPRTGWPAERVQSASIVATAASEADAISTAAFILGVDWVQSEAAKQNWGAVLLAGAADSLPTVVNVADKSYRNPERRIEWLPLPDNF